MAWCIHELDAMRGVTQKGGAAGHALEYPTGAFATQVVGDATSFGNQMDKRFGLMGIEIIDDKDPYRRWVGLNRGGHMGDKIRLRAGRSHGRDEHPTMDDIEIGDQAEGAMAKIFKFHPFDLPRAHGLGWGNPFKGLDTGHFIAADDMPTQGIQEWGIGIQRTDGFDLLLKGVRVVFLGRGVQPIPTAMGLQIRLILKNARPCGPKWWSQCLV